MHDSLEGAIAAALLSPIGTSIGAIAPALVNGSVSSALTSAGMTCASAVILAIIGACVRAWDRATIERSGDGAPATAVHKIRAKAVSTQLAYHLSAPLSIWRAIAYACVVGTVAALSESTTTVPDAAMTLTAVGLAIATAITVPFVAVGIALHDALVRSKHARRESVRGAYLSGSRAACAVAGTVMSGAVVFAVIAWHQGAPGGRL